MPFEHALNQLSAHLKAKDLLILTVHRFKQPEQSKLDWLSMLVRSGLALGVSWESDWVMHCDDDLLSPAFAYFCRSPATCRHGRVFRAFGHDQETSLERRLEP